MVKITDTTAFGEEVKSPDFNKDIKVTFQLDISAKTKRDLMKIIEDESDESSNKFVSELVRQFILDWNLYDEDEKKFEISFEVISEKFPQKLAKWLIDEVQSFMIPVKN